MQAHTPSKQTCPHMLHTPLPPPPFLFCVRFVKLRWSEPDRARPFRTPGGWLGVALVSLPMTVTALVTIISSGWRAVAIGAAVQLTLVLLYCVRACARALPCCQACCGPCCSATTVSAAAGSLGYLYHPRAMFVSRHRTKSDASSSTATQESANTQCLTPGGGPKGIGLHPSASRRAPQVLNGRGSRETDLLVGWS